MRYIFIPLAYLVGLLMVTCTLPFIWMSVLLWTGSWRRTKDALDFMDLKESWVTTWEDIKRSLK